MRLIKKRTCESCAESSLHVLGSQTWQWPSAAQATL